MPFSLPDSQMQVGGLREENRALGVEKEQGGSVIGIFGICFPQKQIHFEDTNLSVSRNAQLRCALCDRRGEGTLSHRDMGLLKHWTEQR